MCEILLKRSRFLQAKEKEGANPELVASALQSYKSLIVEMAKLGPPPTNWSVLLFSIQPGEPGEGAQSIRHAEGDIGPAPLEVINRYLKSAELQHKIAGAEIEWLPLEVADREPAWKLEIRYPHITIALIPFEERTPEGTGT